MLNYCIIAIALILFGVGLIGCVLPIIPGPIVAACGYALLFATEKVPSMKCFLCVIGLTILVTLLDILLSPLLARVFSCSKLGMTLCIVGSFSGFIVGPIGVIIGPFLGALLGEILEHKTFMQAIVSALGAFLGFLCGVGVKLFVVVLIVWMFCKHLYLS